MTDLLSNQPDATDHSPWNKGKLVGQKPPLKLKEIWAIRIQLQILDRTRDLALFNLAIDSKLRGCDLALFNLAIDSKLRGCDLVRIRVADIVHGSKVLSRATVMQQKTGLPVRFELSDQTRETIQAWIGSQKLGSVDYLFPSRMSVSPHITTRQHARIVDSWVSLIGLDRYEYGTHSLRRTKATLIYHRTKNLRAVQLLLGHTKLESTVRYLGIEVDDALAMAEQTEV
ncbi:MAG: tyrosine-type recombinase/integrase [Gammaproteobacteria bacterium]|nr:tyrosine-type recombinase/integrase [Gammaproteobacteria bacterium]